VVFYFKTFDFTIKDQVIRYFISSSFQFGSSCIKRLLVKNEKLDYHERKVFFIMSLFKISFFHFQELTMGFGQGPGDVSAVASSRLGSCSLKDQSIADAEWYWGEINREEVRHLYFPK
jgi:hypothetical protein